jgi:hypothetical protein
MFKASNSAVPARLLPKSPAPAKTSAASATALPPLLSPAAMEKALLARYPHIIPRTKAEQLETNRVMGNIGNIAGTYDADETTVENGVAKTTTASWKWSFVDDPPNPWKDTSKALHPVYAKAEYQQNETGVKGRDIWAYDHDSKSFVRLAINSQGLYAFLEGKEVGGKGPGTSAFANSIEWSGELSAPDGSPMKGPNGVALHVPVHQLQDFRSGTKPDLLLQYPPTAYDSTLNVGGTTITATVTRRR